MKNFPKRKNGRRKMHSKRWTNAVRARQLSALDGDMAGDSGSTSGITTYTQASTPSDHSRKTIGVGELVTCSVDSTYGASDWAIESGGGSLSGPMSSVLSVTFIAPPTGSTVVISATAPGKSPQSVTLTVVTPSGVAISKASSTRHIYGVASVGFYGQPSLQPTGVNFEQVQVREDSCSTNSWGYYASNPVPSHSAGSYSRVINANQLSDQDGIATITYALPYSAGGWEWDIPWIYQMLSGGTEYTFATIPEVAVIDGGGTNGISKAGASASAALSDSNSLPMPT